MTFDEFKGVAKDDYEGDNLHKRGPLLPEALGLVKVEPHVGVHLEAHFVQELVRLHHLRSNSDTD